MRKRLKIKKRSCDICKPHKRKWSSRWTPQEESLLKIYENTIQDIKNGLFKEKSNYKHNQYVEKEIIL